MASLNRRQSKKTGKTLYTVQFTLGRRRPCVPLGSVTKAQAQQAKGYIESLVACRRSNVALDGKTAAWLADVDEGFYQRLVKVGLVEPRQAVTPTPEPEAVTLGEFIDGYIASRTDVKPNTREHLVRCRNSLIGHFGPQCPLNAITPGDADEFRRSLRPPMAENTVRRTCGRAKQFFRAAARKKLIADSPFADMGDTNARANKSREHFVSREVAAKFLAACDPQWAALFALARFGGLRCPSEVLKLTWGDVDWQNGRITVHAPKTEHHEGKAERIIPLFDELREPLQAALDELLEDFDPKAKRLSEEPVICRYRDGNSNLRTQFNRICKKAGVKPWGKPFQNCRSTRETELAESFPIHVVCDWIGNSQAVAAKHYLQVTDEHFAAASEICAANALQQSMAAGVISGNERNEKCEIPEDCENPRGSA